MTGGRPDPLVVALVGSALSAPVLVRSIMDGRMPLETALTRVAVILALTWCGAAVLGALLRATSEPARTGDPVGTDGAAGTAAERAARPVEPASAPVEARAADDRSPGGGDVP